MNATTPPKKDTDETAAEALNRAHDSRTTASTESNDPGGLGEGGGLGGEAGVTSPGNAADGGPSADPGHTHAAQSTGSGKP